MGTSLLRVLALLALSAAALAGESKVAVLDVPGMFCSLCQISVRKALERVSGVLEAKADNNSKRAEVKYDPEKTSPEQFAAALTKAGFIASVRGP